MYLLDTNAVSEMSRHPDGPVGCRAQQLYDDEIATSIIVAAELRFGLAHKPSARLADQLSAVFASLTILPLEADADEHYARIRADLARRGKLIGANDMLVAAHAMALGATLVTDDGDFSRIEGLVIENWLRD